jgi:magnesium transporter
VIYCACQMQKGLEVQMISFTTFFLSRIINSKVYDLNGKLLGVLKDLLIESNHTLDKPRVLGFKLRTGGKSVIYSSAYLKINKFEGKFNFTCSDLSILPDDVINNGILLADVILDKQIVDLNGRKLVRVNDVRLVRIKEDAFVVAVDIGAEGLFRRIGIGKTVQLIFRLFHAAVPSKFIRWEDVEAVDFNNLNIKLSKVYTKLQTLHPSDIADIIEDLDKKSRTEVFSSLDEEQAADVLEELETEAQVHIVESLPLEKVADVLEKMPANEVADLLDELEDDKAELLLKEMEADSSQEVRDLLEYPDNSVGSIMSTEVLTYKETLSVDEILNDIRIKKPEAEELYSLFVTGEKDELIATFTLRDLILAPASKKISEIMKPSPAHLHDYEKLDEVAEMISKYSLLSIPVVDEENILQGTVVVDDVVEDLINKRRTNK